MALADQIQQYSFFLCIANGIPPRQDAFDRDEPAPPHPTKALQELGRYRMAGTVVPLHGSDNSASATQTVKDLYEVGEIPPLGHVPARMYAWAIRRERHGAPEDGMQVEGVETPSIG